MGGVFYTVIFLLQVAAFIINLTLYTPAGSPALFALSAGAFFLSLILTVIAAIKNIQGFILNCLTIIFIIVNIFMYMIYLFGGFLGEYQQMI